MQNFLVVFQNPEAMSLRYVSQNRSQRALFEGVEEMELNQQNNYYVTSALRFGMQVN